MADDRPTRNAPKSGPIDTDQLAADIKKPRFKRPPQVAEGLAQFRELARGTAADARPSAEREPSVVIILDVGQYITGQIERTGTYFGEFGRAAVLVFNPELFDTNVAVGSDGEILDDLGPDVRPVFVCLGTMLRNGVNVAAGDLVHIERHEDTPNKDPERDPYWTYTAVAQRGRAGMKPFDELPAPPDTAPRFDMRTLEKPL